jgi:tRNA(fMet)-specific endonuclease VapC
MSARFMLDTNVVIHIKKGQADVTSRFAAVPSGRAAMSAITLGELRFGAEKSLHRERDLRLLGELNRIIPVEAIDANAAVAYGEIRADLERRGQMIGPNDLWIAAHARSAGYTLVTSNEREFRRVPGLAVENWAAAA